jgi:hypothetical protein
MFAKERCGHHDRVNKSTKKKTSPFFKKNSKNFSFQNLLYLTSHKLSENDFMGFIIKFEEEIMKLFVKLKNNVP